MPFNLMVPHPEQRTVKDVILKELSIKGGLSVPQLRIKAKSGNLSVTYHAVYQAIKDLEEDKVVLRTGNHYSISNKYVEALKDYVQNLESQRTEQASLDIPLNTTKHLSFRSLNEATLFLARAAYSNLFGMISNRDIYIKFQHLWLIQTIKFVRSLNLVKKVARINKWHCLIQGDSLVDRQLKKTYERDFKANIRLGIPCAPISNVVVSGDIVVESFIPKKLIAMQDKVFSSATDKFDLDWIERYTKLCYYDKYSIPATISRNAQVAERHKEDVLSALGK